MAGTLDVAMRCQVNQTEGGDGQVAAVTAITQRNGLNLGVGTSTGQVENYGSLANPLVVCIFFPFSQVLLYDLRSSKPLLVKDHMYGLPIKRVIFTEGSEEEGRVLSMDSQVAC